MLDVHLRDRTRADQVNFDELRAAVVEPAVSGYSVGLEIEAFPMGLSGDRLSIGDVAARLGWPQESSGDPHITVGTAGVGFEPGGQIEVSTPPSASISESIDAQIRAWEAVSDLVSSRLVFVGLDLWNRAERVPLQLAAPRYPAMGRYFASRSRWGQVMMKHTASVQINLDGGGTQLAGRVAVAQALAPFITASFSASPGPTAHSDRARVWQRLDPTRTGFLDLSDGVACAMWSKAMRADVLVVRRPDGWHPGRPGFSYANWLERGHSVWGQPESDDLRYHLTTLFPEVRPRHGTLEIRSPDSLPLRWLPALVVLVAAAVYDDAAGPEIGELVSRHPLPRLWWRAAVDGLDDTTIASVARQVWLRALEAARAMTPAIDTPHLDTAEAFVERFVLTSLAPAAELRASLARGAVHGLDWASFNPSTNGEP